MNDNFLRCFNHRDYRVYREVTLLVETLGVYLTPGLFFTLFTKISHFTYTVIKGLISKFRKKYDTNQDIMDIECTANNLKP